VNSTLHLFNWVITLELLLNQCIGNVLDNDINGNAKDNINYDADVKGWYQ
jgi:hypothetical protein